MRMSLSDPVEIRYTPYGVRKGEVVYTTSLSKPLTEYDKEIKFEYDEEFLKLLGESKSDIITQQWSFDGKTAEISINLKRKTIGTWGLFQLIFPIDKGCSLNIAYTKGHKIHASPIPDLPINRWSESFNQIVREMNTYCIMSTEIAIAMVNRFIELCPHINKLKKYFPHQKVSVDFKYTPPDVYKSVESVVHNMCFKHSPQSPYFSTPDPSQYTTLTANFKDRTETLYFHNERHMINIIGIVMLALGPEIGGHYLREKLTLWTTMKDISGLWQLQWIYAGCLFSEMNRIFIEAYHLGIIYSEDQLEELQFDFTTHFEMPKFIEDKMAKSIDLAINMVTQHTAHHLTNILDYCPLDLCSFETEIFDRVMKMTKETIRKRQRI